MVVAIETLDLNDNAPELDRQYTAAMCDSSATGQVRVGVYVCVCGVVWCVLTVCENSLNILVDSVYHFINASVPPLL